MEIHFHHVSIFINYFGINWIYPCLAEKEESIGRMNIEPKLTICPDCNKEVEIQIAVERNTQYIKLHTIPETSYGCNGGGKPIGAK